MDHRPQFGNSSSQTGRRVSKSGKLCGYLSRHWLSLERAADPKAGSALRTSIDNRQSKIANHSWRNATIGSTFAARRAGV